MSYGRIGLGLVMLAGACAPAADPSESSASAYEFEPCLVADPGDRTDGSSVGPSSLEDDTGKASVAVSGGGCARSFTITSTAPRRDNFPSGPRVVAESASRSSVQTNNALFDALYQLALEEAAENSVSAIRDYAFNDGGDLACPTGGCFETGRKWTYVWTRDTSYSAHLGLGWVDPIRTKNSLEIKLSTRRDGSDLQIVQDTGTGGSYPVSTDRAVWALGASETLLHLTGDAHTKFKAKALTAAKNTVEHDRSVIFDSADGLYRGEQSFLDWREQTYPAWTVPDTVNIASSKSLSTNLDHLALLDLAAKLSGDAKYAGWARDLRVAIKKRFWLADEKQLSTFVTTDLDPSAAHRFDLLGSSLAVLLDVATGDDARSAVTTYPTLPKGPPVIFPQQKETAIYHNRAIWPFVTAYWAKAARKVGSDGAFDAAMLSLVRGAALNLSNMENLEVVTGKAWVDDGQFSGPVVNSQRQLWSVAGYIGSVVGGLFGVEATDGGVRVAPFMTAGLHQQLFAGAKSIVVNDIPLRGKKISVVVRLPANGTGAYRVASTRFNGNALKGDVVADKQLGARNLFEIELTSGESVPTRVLRDVSDYRTLYAPRTPAAFLGSQNGKLGIWADLSGENQGDVTWNVYRDGQLVGTGLTNDGPFIDSDSDGDRTPGHCYAIESVYRTSKNASQHSKPVCFFGSGRIQSVNAPDFETRGGQLVNNHGRDHWQFWGDRDHVITASFTANQTGTHLVQATYGNGAGSLNTGITCAVKHAIVEDAESGSVVGDGMLIMPHRGSWDSWGESSFVRAALTAGRRYRVKLVHDAKSVNMSAFEHFEAYTGGTGGRSGEFFRVNVAEIKLLSLAP